MAANDITEADRTSLMKRLRTASQMRKERATAVWMERTTYDRLLAEAAGIDEAIGIVMETIPFSGE